MNSEEIFIKQLDENSSRLPSLFFACVAPSVMAFALSGVYTVVDGFFVGNRLGDPGLAAIALAYPMAALIQAMGTGLGMAGAIRFAILDARGEEWERKQCLTAAMALLILVSVLVTAAGAAFLGPVLGVLGAEGDIFTLSEAYARVIVLGAGLQILGTGLVPFVRNMGGAAHAMAAMVTGFAANIVLDYALVWQAGMGMAGAAWATVMGQGMTVLLAAAFMVRRRVRLAFPKASAFFWNMKMILKVSFAPFGLTFSPNVTLIFMNKFLLIYGGDRQVSAYGCIAYITAVVYLLLQGVGDGSQPLFSRFYGEGDKMHLRGVRALAYGAGAAVAVVCMAGLFAARGQVGRLFGASAETGEDVALALIPFLLAFPMIAFLRITTSYFYATEKNLLAYVLIYAEPVLLVVVLAVLPPFAGLGGVWLAVPLSQAAIFILGFFTKIRTDT